LNNNKNNKLTKLLAESDQLADADNSTKLLQCPISRPQLPNGKIFCAKKTSKIFIVWPLWTPNREAININF
jgi:hypothetical protein